MVAAEPVQEALSSKVHGQLLCVKEKASRQIWLGVDWPGLPSPCGSDTWIVALGSLLTFAQTRLLTWVMWALGHPDRASK